LLYFVGMSTDDDLRAKFGKRIQRCPGCYIAYYLKDMWLAEEGGFFCDDCKDEATMFHFDAFSRAIDLSALPSLRDDD
jgi:hypothetical protein